MGPKDVVLAPWRLAGTAHRALDDLHTIAQHARRDPDPVEEARERIDVLIDELRRLLVRVDAVIVGAAELTTAAGTVDGRVERLIAVAQPLLALVEQLDRTGRDIVLGGDDLHRTTIAVEHRAGEIVTGGQDLTAVAQRLDQAVRQILGAVPEALHGLAAVEEMEGAVETLADTVEPLQDTAAGVGRLTQRLSRDGGRGRLPSTP